MSDRTVVQLGDRVRDRITGFEGIVIGITEWLYQCRRPIIQPSSLTSDGKLSETQSFDEDQLEIVEAGAFSPRAIESAPPAEQTGGPRATPAHRSTPEGRR